MKKYKIAVAIIDHKLNEVVDQIDYDVPDIFNTYDVCDECKERTKCNNCIVQLLQSDGYVRMVM